MDKIEKLKLNFIRKWTSLLNEKEVVRDLDEYAQQVSRGKAFDCVYDYYHYTEKCKEDDIHTETIEIWFNKWIKNQ